MNSNLIKQYSKIYNIHKYWSRKPWQNISKNISKYSNENDIILDPFMGSGVTALESIILNRNYIGYDLNPIAIFIAQNTLNYEICFEKLLSELKDISININPIIEQIYRSEWVCPTCNQKYTIQHCCIGPKYANNPVAKIYCENCGKKISQKYVPYPPNVDYIDHTILKWIPELEFPKQFYKDRFSYKGICTINDMYTKKNLYFLSELHHIITTSNYKYENIFKLAFTNTLLHASKLKSENIRPLGVNNYWIPDDYIEENIWNRFLIHMDRIIQAKKILLNRIKNRKLGKYELHNKSSLKLLIKNESIDYIITDPPYGDAIQYSELSYIWNGWLNSKYDISEEVIINPMQSKTMNSYINLLSKSISESSRVLKQNKYYTLCFHNKNLTIWQDILNLFKQNSFTLINIDIKHQLGNSYNNNWAKYSPKTDIYLTFQKYPHTYTHNNKYELKDLISIDEQTNISNSYNNLLKKFIWEIYFNKYQIKLTNNSIKSIFKQYSHK